MKKSQIGPQTYYGFILLCMVSIVMVMNYRTTSNVVNYTVLDVKQDIHFYDEPEGMSFKLTFLQIY